MAFIGSLLATWPGRALAALLVGALVVGGVVASGIAAAPAKVEYRTAPVTRGAVTQTVAVSGSINPAGSVRLNFKQAGRLAEVLVSVGSQVTSGQPLAKLDLTDLQIALATAQANLSSAKAKYDQTVAGAAAEDVAIARQAFDNAQRSLESTRRTTQGDVAAAQQSLAKAATGYDAARANFATYTAAVRGDVASYQSGLDTSRAQLTRAQDDLAALPSQTSDVRAAQTSLNQAQSALANAWSSANGVLASALTDYATAQAGLQTAIAAFDAAIGTGKDTTAPAALHQTAQAAYTTTATRLSNALDATSGQIATAQSAASAAQNSLMTVANRADTTLDPARTLLAALQTSLVNEQQLASAVKAKVTQAGSALSTIGDAVGGSLVAARQSATAAQERGAASVSSAENTLESARLSLAKTSSGPKSFDVAVAYASVLIQQAALDTATNNLANATLRSPTAGIVASVNAQVGEFVAGGGTANPFMVVANLTSLALHGTVGEADVARLRHGQVATVTVDAVAAAARMTGKVTAIDPVATIQQGVPVYGIDVTVDIASAGVRPGMSGTANAIIASKQDVLTVPNLAIRSQAGRRFVQVLRDGQPAEVAVTFGIANETVTEVTSGVEEGDLVVLPQPRAAASAQGGGGGQFRLGGGPGPGVPAR